MQEALHAVAQQARQEYGGRAVPQRNIHATLAFLGNVPRERMADIGAVASGIGGSRCDLAVDRLLYWRHNRIVWAGLECCPAPLGALAASLANGLRAAGFGIDDRPYAFHVTLLRNARRAPAAREIASVAWPIEHFALIESVPRAEGRVYEVLKRWPFKG